MFRSLLYDHPQGLSFVLSAFITFSAANDEASSGKVVNALSTKDNP
jgi:hypothetical protein